MVTLPGPVEILLHLDTYLFSVIELYGVWTYLLLFGIIFMETGFVVTPFFPGDSLLFVAGAFASAGVLRIDVLLPLLTVAAFAGDQVNYWIGRWTGHKVLARNGRFIKLQYVSQAQEFFDRYGKVSVFFARFVPIVRTFVPFLAGVGSMHYRWFVIYDGMGAAAWVSFFIGAGYISGNIPIVRDNLSLLIILVLIATFAVIGIGFLKRNRERIAERLRHTRQK